MRRGAAGSATTVSAYGYDGSRRLVRRTVPGGSFHYGYLPDTDRRVRVVEPDGSEWHLVHAWAGAPHTLAVTADGRARYVHVDPFEQVIGVSDETGALTAIEEDCYGRRRLPSAGGPDLGFHGMLYEEQTGLYLAGPRAYDPRAGEFLSPDPAGLLAGPDPWGYGRGNPVLNRDPSGRLLPLLAGALIAGALIANEIRTFAQSDEVGRARKSYQDLTNLDDEDALESAEEAHKDLHKAADKGGDAAIKAARTATEAVTDPAGDWGDVAEQAADAIGDAIGDDGGQGGGAEADSGAWW